MAAIENYAWRSMLDQSDPSKAAISNSQSGQCFPRASTIGVRFLRDHPGREEWSSWLQQDVLKTRVGPSAGITYTQYAGAGSRFCSTFNECENLVGCESAPTYFHDSGFDGTNPPWMNQLGTKAAANDCGLDGQGDWKTIVNHYFAGFGSVRDGSTPPGPQVARVSNTAPRAHAGQVVLTFQSLYRKHPVAWRYSVYRSPNNQAPWKQICCAPQRGASGMGFPRIGLTYEPPAGAGGSKCYYYKVRAHNPVGPSRMVQFVAVKNSSDHGKKICPAPS